MATKFEKAAREVNDAFTRLLGEKFRDRFGRDLETTFDFLDSMQLVSRPADGLPFTPEQRAWVEIWSDGYAEAQDVVWRLANPLEAAA